MVDYWTFGCLLYEMLLGFPPFKASGNNHNVLFATIVQVIFILTKGTFKLPMKMDEDTKDLIKRLLVTNVIECLNNSLASDLVPKVSRR